MENEVRFEIVKKICVLKEYSTGWTRELNLVSWNGYKPKYDIRDWDPAHERMSRGITLNKSEMSRIADVCRAKEFANDTKTDPVR